EALDGGGDVAVAGQDDDRDLGRDRLQPAQQLQPVRAGHSKVGEHEVDRGLGHQGHRLHGGGGGLGVEAPRAQDGDQGVAHVGLVLDHQYAPARDRPLERAHGASRAGSVIRKSAPPPSLAPTVSSPPCCRTIEWQMESPRPVESLVEKKGSKIRSRSASFTPWPRSAISATAWAPTRCERMRTSPPRGCASQALRTRFTATCASMTGFPRTSNGVRSRSRPKLTPANSFRDSRNSSVSRRTWLRSTVTHGAFAGSDWPRTWCTIPAARSRPSRARPRCSAAASGRPPSSP